MKIDSIKNGIVIDHITAGKGMEIYRLLDLDATDYSVALIKNVSSSKMGKKDILKVECDINMLNLDVLAFIAEIALPCLLRLSEVLLCLAASCCAASLSAQSFLSFSCV